MGVRIKQDGQVELSIRGGIVVICIDHVELKMTREEAAELAKVLPEFLAETDGD